MKIHISTRGDRSVGLQGGYVMIEGLSPPDDSEERAYMRQVLASLFSDLMGEPAGVVFNDELDIDSSQEEKSYYDK